MFIVACKGDGIQVSRKIVLRKMRNGPRFNSFIVFSQSYGIFFQHIRQNRISLSLIIIRMMNIAILDQYLNSGSFSLKCNCMRSKQSELFMQVHQKNILPHTNITTLVRIMFQ